MNHIVELSFDDWMVSSALDTGNFSYNMMYCKTCRSLVVMCIECVAICHSFFFRVSKTVWANSSSPSFHQFSFIASMRPEKLGCLSHKRPQLVMQEADSLDLMTQTFACTPRFSH